MGGIGTVVEADSRVIEVKIDRRVHAMFQRGKELPSLGRSFDR